MITYAATVGKPVEIFLDMQAVTGLDFQDFTSVQVLDGSRLADLEELQPTLTEIDSVTVPGMYLLTIIPNREGALLLRFVYGVVTAADLLVQSTVALPPFVADASLEGDYTYRALSGSSAVQGAIVRIYDATGYNLLQRLISDSQGYVHFALPTGSYQVRSLKTGVDFSSVNPTTIYVLPNDAVNPRIDELLPASGEGGSSLVVTGGFLGPDAELVFGSEGFFQPLATNRNFSLAAFEVPVGVDSVIPVRIRKPDPASMGDFLYSNAVNYVRQGV